jgi:hypothetical protein
MSAWLSQRQLVSCLLVSIAAFSMFRVETSSLTGTLHVARSGHQATLLLMRPACRHRRRWCAGISRFPRPSNGAWKMSTRSSWYGWRRRRLRRVRWNESRTTHGDSCSSPLLSRRRTRSSSSPIRPEAWPKIGGRIYVPAAAAIRRHIKSAACESVSPCSWANECHVQNVRAWGIRTCSRRAGRTMASRRELLSRIPGRPVRRVRRVDAP